MTNIYNRRRFFEIIEKQFNFKKDNLIAVMIDIDNFKRINDTYGHSVGDKVIQHLARLITEALPKDAIFGRLGGEEFAIVCRRPSADIVTTRMEQIRHLIDSNSVSIDNDGKVKYTISLGISQYNKEISTVDDLLSSADKALYHAKGAGRNRVILRE